MATTAPAVALHGVTKRFGRLVAVKTLDLAVEPGFYRDMTRRQGRGSRPG